MIPETDLGEVTTSTSSIDIDDAPVVDVEQPRRRRRRLRWIAALTAVALAVSAVLLIRSNKHTASAVAGTPVSAAELQTKYGVRVDLVALTGLGGLIQLRFTVLDKAKAETLFHVAENMPALIVEGSGKVLHAPSGMRHHLTLLDGASYFVLYANAANSVSPGTPVSVQIDRVKLEHLVTAN